MKKLLLFALLSSVSAFGQAYSDSVTQNSPGNYGRPVPYASVQVCAISDTNTPCTTKVQTFTDDTLSVACTQSAGSGVLTGAPSSGTNCNNPGIADANGNFTIYVVAGQYRICTYANNWLCQNVSVGGSGGGIPFACASAVNGSIVGMTSTTTSSCDPNGITDFIGHWTSQSYRATGAFNGVVELIGGQADPINVPDTNSFAFLAPLTVPTPYYFRPPGTVGSVGQCWGLQSQVVGTNGTIDNAGWQNCVASAGTVEFQTNGVDNLNCTAGACPLQNLVPGANCTITNTSGGNVTINCTGGLPTTQIANPTAPTLANQNAAGARSITYLVQGLEDVNGVYHTANSGSTTIANANASPQVLLSAYGDILYGPRCFDVYVTADSGGRATGLIAHCVGKQFIDTGGGGSGSATNTNTTVLTINMSPNPGCNIPPNGIIGVDAPPCSPTIYDDEGGTTFQVPGHAQLPDWIWQNQGSATSGWSGGVMVLQSDTGGSPNYELLQRNMGALPGTPYTFETFLDTQGITNPSFGGIALRESGTTKMAMCAMLYQAGSGGMSLYLIDSTGYAGLTVVTNQNIYGAGTGYVWMQNDGTNINCYYSPAGDGVRLGRVKYGSVAVTTAFTTAPDQVAVFANRNATGSIMSFDFFRRTQ